MVREKVPVTLRALVARINRKLAKGGEMLHTLRGQRYEQEFGRYYIVNLDANRVDTTDVDPEALARELGVMRPWEALEDTD